MNGGTTESSIPPSAICAPTTSKSSSLAGADADGFVGSGAVNRRHSGPGQSQIDRELAAVMNVVEQFESAGLDERNVPAVKVDGFRPVFRRQLLEQVVICGNR